MELSANNVCNVFAECFYCAGAVEDISTPKERVPVHGIVHDYTFLIDPLEKRREDIVAMLEQLPEQFHEKGGGGWSFLNSCDDKNGKQWTGLHMTMEQLWCLGMAIGRAKYTLPREYWGSLYGSMPYLTVTAIAE